MVVADASPLIVLAKLRRLWLLRDLYDAVLLGPVVKAEAVDAGKAIRAVGVEQIEAALEDGWLRVVDLSEEEQSLQERLTRLSRLGRGEAEAIALASGRGARLIADDLEARHVAETVGADYVGTAGVLLDAHMRRRLTFGELETALRDLCEVLWLSPAVVAEILRVARETDS